MVTRSSSPGPLAVWMNGDRVGTWSIEQGKDQFQYDSRWPTLAHSRALSLTLPQLPGNQANRSDAVGFWFDNLLPDSTQLRERIARRFRTRGQSAMELLGEIGRDCVGAVQLLPSDQAPPQVKAIEAEPLNEAGVAQLLRRITDPQVGQGDPVQGQDFRISLAGAQEKTALLKVDGQWMRPRGTTPTTHILKLPLGLIGPMKMDMGHSVENEWLCAQLLKAYGLPVADCRIERFEGMKVLAVERFDRAWSQDRTWVMRLPQEDMCQALGYPSHLKYESDGGPGMDRILSLLNGSSQAEQDKFHFIKAQFLFWLLRAPDGHAKNFSIRLMAGGPYAMTPLYDVMSVFPHLGQGPNQVSGHQVKMAMAVRSKNAHWKMHEIEPRHWLALARRHGLSTAGPQSPFEQVIAHTSTALNAVRAQLPPDFPEQVSRTIFEGLEASVSRFSQGL
jgi:serine/threonine-protein kinase HipA